MRQLSLLQEATQEWFALRAFSVANQLLEQYIRATKKDIEQEKNYISIMYSKFSNSGEISLLYNLAISSKSEGSYLFIISVVI